MTSPRLSAEQRRALTLLASIPHGIAEELLILVHRFDRAMIAGLAHGGPRNGATTAPQPSHLRWNNDPKSELPVLIVLNFGGVTSLPHGATSG